jgi:hypothetical protein
MSLERSIGFGYFAEGVLSDRKGNLCTERTVIVSTTSAHIRPKSTLPPLPILTPTEKGQTEETDQQIRRLKF